MKYENKLNGLIEAFIIQLLVTIFLMVANAIVAHVAAVLL